VEFRRDHVGGSCGEFAGVVYLVASCRNADAIRIVFLGAICDDNLCVSGRMVCRDVRNVSGFHDEDGICPDGPGFLVALTHSPEIFTERCHPYFGGARVVHEFVIAGDVLTGDGVYHGETVVFDVALWVGGVKLEGNESVGCCDGVICDQEVNSFLADETNVA
jgi:hypothetical protein